MQYNFLYHFLIIKFKLTSIEKYIFNDFRIFPEVHGHFISKEYS